MSVHRGRLVGEKRRRIVRVLRAAWIVVGSALVLAIILADLVLMGRVG